MSKFIPKGTLKAPQQQPIVAATAKETEGGQLTLASVSELILSLKPSLTNSESTLKLISTFLAQQYSRGVARPDVLSELCKNKDTATNGIEKRVGMFMEKLVTGQEKHALRIAKERVGRVSKENVAQALKEAVFCKAVQLTAGIGPIRPKGIQPALIGFGCIDGLLTYTSILADQANAATDIKEIISIVDSLNVIDREALKSKSLALIKDETSDKPFANGKSLESNVTVTPDYLLSMLRSHVDGIVGTLVKKTSSDDSDVLQTLRLLAPSLLSLMSHPLLVSPFATKALSSKNPQIQDQALTTVLCLITRYSFDMPDFHSRLYDLVKSRKTLSLPLLRLLEVSLKSAELPSTTVVPFVKVSSPSPPAVPAQMSQRTSRRLCLPVVALAEPPEVKRGFAGSFPGAFGAGALLGFESAARVVVGDVAERSGGDRRNNQLSRDSDAQETLQQRGTSARTTARKRYRESRLHRNGADSRVRRGPSHQDRPCESQERSVQH